MVSKEAAVILKLIQKEKIPFSLEYSFQTEPHKKQKRYRYDFAIFNKNNQLKLLIEYDSIIHFKYIPGLHKKRSAFNKACERDLQKNQYCLLNNIPLYRIPYYDLDKLKKYDDLLKDEYKVKSKWHNHIITQSLKKKGKI